jgi:hypothetical protein
MMNMRFRHPALALAGLLGATLTPSAWAADSRGHYAARGAYATQTCEQFQASVQAGGASLTGAVAWIDGVLTGINMAFPATFDISPYRGAAIVPAMVLQQCAATPQVPAHAALFQVISALAPVRAQSDGPVVAMTANGQSLAVREETLKFIQQSLMQRGFLRTQRADGRYTETLRAALKAFQEQERLPVTELPDPETLFRLIRR